MSKKNLLSGRDKELQEMAEQYEAAKAENRTIYLDADDLADLADWYAVHHKYAMATEVVEYGLGIHPDNTALLVEQAYLFLDTQHKEQAKDILERIAEESSEVKVLKANLLLGEGKEEEAEAILDSIDDKDDLANIVDVSYMYIDMGFPETLTEATLGALDTALITPVPGRVTVIVSDILETFREMEDLFKERLPVAFPIVQATAFSALPPSVHW